MGFNKVFKTLQELFPEIDARVLKAVAIEHNKDPDDAVCIVLEEIIPFFTEKSVPSSPLSRISSSSEPPEAVLASAHSEGQSMNFDGISSSGLQNGDAATYQNQQSLNDADDVHNEHFYDSYNGDHDGEANAIESITSKVEDGIKKNILEFDHDEHALLMDTNAGNHLSAKVSEEPETEEIFVFQADNYLESGVEVSSDADSSNTVETLQVLEKCSSNVDDSVNENNPSTMHGLTQSHSESSLQLSEAPVVVLMDDNNTENSGMSLSADNAKMENLDGKVDIEDAVSDSNMLHSSQMHTVEIIEDMIADARNNKKTMFSAMESVISLMKEVEIKEKAVEQAKEEAAAGGSDVLGKVEELKEMLRRAKNANDMHAGEVYGEKAILATELRELQFRVLSLADQRDKSLAVLDEMRQGLQIRLAAAEEEIKSVELEKLEKEKGARLLLAEQETIMEKVVQESNILKKQAEENAKLQEFLLDRGSIIDALQGEIAVICQDVNLLKEKFDERVPFSKSLTSSQTSCILASSSSSAKNLILDQVEPILSDEIITDTLDAQKKTDPVSYSDEVVSEEKTAGDDRKAHLDDEWEFLIMKLQA